LLDLYALPFRLPCSLLRTVAAYCQLASEWGMSGASLALRFVLDHPLVASAVIGVTSSRQLEELVAAAARPPLDAALAAAVDDIHRRYPNPTP
jgi:aryl-alcohol dehydrogenase-like predicted oxidoreductase